MVLLGKKREREKKLKYFLLIIHLNLITFFLLLGGVFLSLVVAILEFLWHARKNHENRRVSFELINHIMFF